MCLFKISFIENEYHQFLSYYHSPAAIADLKSLFNFYVDGNKFTGTVPQQLCRPALNADFFEGIDMDNVVGSDVCDSVACRPGYVSFEGVYPCSMCEEQFFNPYLGR